MEQKSIKKNLVSDNMKYCNIGPLKNLPLGRPIKNNYNNNFCFGETDFFADVYIVKDIHAISLAKEYMLKHFNPIILNTVTKEFDGNNIPSSQGILDDIINVRTNFYKTSANYYPLKYSEVIYSPCITVIRNDSFVINPPEFFRINLITATPVNSPKLEDGMLNLEDYIVTKETIENIFQTAAQTNHDVLILNDFGCVSEKIPVNELVDIFNLCILHYGSLFKTIIFSIQAITPAQEAIYYYFLKNIIKTQELVNSGQNNNQEQEPSLPVSNPLIKQSFTK